MRVVITILTVVATIVLTLTIALPLPVSAQFAVGEAQDGALMPIIYSGTDRPLPQCADAMGMCGIAVG
jgi:hypothetical protein